MYDRHRLAERLQRALALRRWSEVQVIADQLRGADDGRSSWRRWLLPLGNRGLDRTMSRISSQREMAKTDGAEPRDKPSRRGATLFCSGSTPSAAFWFVWPMKSCWDRRRTTSQRRRADSGGHLAPPCRHPTRCRGVLAPAAAHRADRRPIDRTADNAGRCYRVLELGDGVKLRFRRPHPLSTSARLEPASTHRTRPSTDAVLLMADACILGPHLQSHVVVPDLRGEIVLFRQGNGLACRGPGTMTIDGIDHERRGPLARNSRVVGDGFSFTLESL